MDYIINYIVNNWLQLSGGLILGLGVGMLTGIFGAGGGFIITPALNIFLGVPMNIAVGTSSCQVLGASGFAIFHNLDKKMKGIKVALLIGLGIPFGSYLGTLVIDRWKNLEPIVVNGKAVDALNFILLIIFAVFLSLIAGWLLFDNFVLKKGKPDNESNHVGLLSKVSIPPLIICETIPHAPFSIPLLVVIGLFMGFLSGLLGIGGGVIMMPMLFYIIGQETKYAILTSTMLIFISGLFATFFHAMHNNINYTLVATLITGAFFGTKAGVKIHKKISGKSIRQYFAFVVLLAAAMVIYKIVRILN
ncbi:MAG: sulfite exporter TauE/SafE family protein [Victivallaceae bacterium]|nr:sulfite exporter TauE/SafE family protein [Victivallaceae bacterium]